MRKQILAAAVAAIGLTGVTAADAAVLARYDFTTASNGNLVPASTDANVTASNVTGGASTTLAVSGGYYVNAVFMTASRSNDTAATAYFQTTITAAPGYELDLTSYTFDGARGGGSTPRSYDVRSSVGGLAITDTSLLSGTFDTARPAAAQPATGTMPTFTIDLSGPAYQNLSTLTIRTYFYTPTTAQNIDLDNFTYNGTASAVPEPATLSLLGVSAAALLGRRRRA
jgi:hypothetical protein